MERVDAIWGPMALLVGLLANANFSGCCGTVDLRDAYLPPTPVRPEVFSVHREIGFDEADYAVKGWAVGDGTVVVCRRADVVRIDAEGRVQSAVRYDMRAGGAVQDAGGPASCEPGAVLSWTHGGRSWLDADYGWIAVSPDGLTARAGEMPRPMRPVGSGGVSGQWREGRAVVAWLDRQGDFVFLEPETGQLLRLAGDPKQPMTYMWGWIPDQADGRSVLVAELKAESYQVGHPRMWVMDPRFDDAVVRKVETVVPREIITFPEAQQYLLYMPDEPREMVMGGGWQWPAGIENRLRVSERVVSVRRDPRDAPAVIPGLQMLGTTPDGQPALVGVETFLPGLEPGKPPKHRAGLSIVVRVDGEVVARSEPLDARTGRAGALPPQTFVVGAGPDGRQICAFVVSDRLVFYSVDPSVVGSLRSPLDEVRR